MTRLMVPILSLLKCKSYGIDPPWGLTKNEMMHPMEGDF